MPDVRRQRWAMKLGPPGQLHGPAYQCNHCGERLDGFSSFDGGKVKPEPGDLTVCLYCSGVLQFADGTYSELSAETWQALPSYLQVKLCKAQTAAAAARAAVMGRAN